MSQPMTVGDLRKSLEGVSDDLLVVARYDSNQNSLIDTPHVEPIQQWWEEGSGWHLPDLEVFVLGEFDPRA